MSNSFVHLHTHSEYSLLDGLGRTKKLVAEAKRLGQPALALTDHGVMHGAIEFFRACRAAEIRPIIGVEAYQTLWGRPMGGRDGQVDRGSNHLLLLAKNMEGYRNLLRICSSAHLDGYYYRPRVDHDFLAEHVKGLIASTGCLGAEVPQLLMQGKEREAYERMGWYVDVFGTENFFIELQEHSVPELVEVNKILVPWAEKFGLQLTVTNDVHYVQEEDGGPHDVLLCVQTGTTVDAENRMRLSDGSYFLKSRQQMEDAFRPYLDLPDSAFDSTVAFAEMCDVDLEDSAYHLPDLPIPEGFTYQTYLRHLTEEGIRQLYGSRADDSDVVERKERELRIINEMGFDVYFLIVADLCDFARERNIWWNVRGSGAASLVAYAIGITGLDPLKNNLIFERFLNPGRVTMPDFDLDFPDDQREELIRYTVEKYGEDQVAQIATFGRMKARAAIRDVGRAKGVDLVSVDRLAKLIPAIPGKPVTIQDVLTEGHEFYNPELVELYKSEPWATDLLDTSMQLEGVARHSSVHAAAVIVSDRELTHYTPLMRGNKNTITSKITQYEFPVLESIGLLKVDFLGLSTLSVMREAARLVHERHDVAFTLGDIPFEGETAQEAFTLLSSGEVSGVFQVESQGMRRVLTEMQPSAFEHIIATISLYRPGPMEYIPQFIKRMHGEEEVSYKHPALAPILAETYGIIVYQEQIIQILSQLAGYTPGEADLVRRAISKKKASEIEQHKKLFIKGCEQQGIPKDAAAAIYGDIEFFARYGFNKAHAADYAVICVQTAYLKAHYPVEYMAALLLIERSKTDKVVNFINECRRMGIDVLPPDVNYSGLDFEIQARPDDTPSMAIRDAHLSYNFPVPEGSAIRFGMAAVKNVGEGPVRVILEARAEGGIFHSLEDFCDRVDLRQVNKRALECLIKVGSFDRFGNRAQMLHVVDQMVAHSAAVHSARESGQLSMFDLLGDAAAAAATPIILPELEEVQGRERLQWEKELLGVYAMSHPLLHLSVDLKEMVTCASNELDSRFDGKNVMMAGMIASVRTITTKKGDPMAFVQLEDMQGQCEVVVFPRTYADEKDKLVPDTVVVVKGKAQTREGQTSVLADVIQNYVDQVLPKEDEHLKYQEPMFEIGPRVNGITVTDDEDIPESESYALADDAYLTEPHGEVSPFQNDPPAWMDVPDVERTENVAATVLESAAGSAEGVAHVATGEQLRSTGEATMMLKERTTAEAVVNDAKVPPSSEPAQGRSNPQLSADKPHNGEGESVPGPHDDAETEDTNGQQSQERSENVGGHTDSSMAVSDEGVNGHPTPAKAVNENGNGNGNGHENGNGVHAKAAQDADVAPTRNGPRMLEITFRPIGNLERDKYRLKEIYDMVRDPRGRDEFLIVLQGGGKTQKLAFPDDLCTINERLTGQLEKFFKVEVSVQERG